MIPETWCPSGHGREYVSDVVESRVRNLELLKTRRVEGWMHIKSSEAQSAVGTMEKLGELDAILVSTSSQEITRSVATVSFQCYFSDDEAHSWLNGYVNKQNCRIWREADPQVYVETALHPEKLTVWCALWAGGILLQKR
ncbi:hypothetical protein TNCV_3565421 [Trichonephila clavipes]|nr:hypothetical protein TNCV_3565421 [Trichonephila clavipes]